MHYFIKSLDIFPVTNTPLKFMTLIEYLILSRGYSEKKVKSNVECEIFQSILEEALEAYDSEIVHELSSNIPEDMEKNVEEIVRWVQTNADNSAE